MTHTKKKKSELYRNFSSGNQYKFGEWLFMTCQFDLSGHILWLKVTNLQIYQFTNLQSN